MTAPGEPDRGAAGDDLVEAHGAPRGSEPVTHRMARRAGAALVVLVAVGFVVGLVAVGALGWWAGVVTGYWHWLPFVPG